jgi:phosphatidyl-myo-inositol alpha-mannosyltransferase
VRELTLFVSATGGLGGPSRSLATVLEHVESGVRVLAAPDGSFSGLVRARRLSDEEVRILDGDRPRRTSTLRSVVRLAAWCWRRRTRLTAIYANGLAELNLAAPAAILSRTPIVVWAHTSDPSAWARRLAPVWRRLLPDVRWAAVSTIARDVLVDIGLCDADVVSIIPNPVDPRDVEASSRAPSDVPTVGYIGPATSQKGFDLLPGIARRLSDLALSWAVFVPAASASAVLDGSEYQALREAVGGRLTLRPWVGDVRDVYAACDIVLCPSRKESFSRVAAEAMVNGLPIVASDLAAFRDLLGDDEAGLLFPAGNAEKAARSMRRLVVDPHLRVRLGERGRTRARAFAPEAVVGLVTSLLQGSRPFPSIVPRGPLDRARPRTGV